jgi:hypothetical protein
MPVRVTVLDHRLPRQQEISYTIPFFHSGLRYACCLFELVFPSADYAGPARRGEVRNPKHSAPSLPPRSLLEFVVIFLILVFIC